MAKEDIQQPSLPIAFVNDRVVALHHENGLGTKVHRAGLPLEWITPNEAEKYVPNIKIPKHMRFPSNKIQLGHIRFDRDTRFLALEGGEDEDWTFDNPEVHTLFEVGKEILEANGIEFPEYKKKFPKTERIINDIMQGKRGKRLSFDSMKKGTESHTPLIVIGAGYGPYMGNSRVEEKRTDRVVEIIPRYRMADIRPTQTVYGDIDADATIEAVIESRLILSYDHISPTKQILTQVYEKTYNRRFNGENMRRLSRHIEDGLWLPATYQVSHKLVGEIMDEVIDNIQEYPEFGSSARTTTNTPDK